MSTLPIFKSEELVAIPKKREKIILIGGGGHCKACIDVIELSGHFHIEGIVDVPDKLHKKLLGYEIIATDDDLPKLVNENENFLVTLGQIKSPEKRIRIFQILKNLKAKLPVIISPLAYVSRHAQIDEGTIVMHHALINAGAKIGRNCIINTKVLIEHDAVIADHCHIATGAIINGGVTVGSGAFFGSKAVSKEYIEIGKNIVIGCGEKITKNIL
jgi:sugar O-acyltransferase (sialic acid O-acetyltransferase NeuD family)